MAGPGGKEVGRVSIRAVPDSRKFRQDLKVMLERVERTVKVTLPTAADTRPAESALQRFQKDWNGRSVTLGAGITTGAAAAQMRFLTRPRIAPVIVRVQKASLAKATALLAAFSGARVAGDLVRNLGDRLASLDRALPKAAFVSTSIANVTSVVLNALGGILTFGAGFGQLLGTLAAAPGILAGMAVGGTTLALALADTKTQLAVLGPAFQQLQNVVSANFWSGARQSILDLARGALPELQAGLGRTATQLGSWAASLAQELAATLGGGRIKTLFDPLVRSIEIASTGLGGFVRGVVSLGEVGGSYLPRLAQWVADLSNRFGAFIEQATASGALQQFIETGIVAAQQLGSILQSVGSIFVGLTTAAAGGGATGFGALATSLAAVAAIVNGPAFQTALSTIFAGAEAGATGLAAALGPIGSMLATLAPTIASILTGSGQVVGQVLGEIATALSSPVFAQGLQAFFTGILSGIQAIAPVLPAIANAFGTLLGFAGALAAELGPVLGSVLAALAPVLAVLLEALKPILPILGGALIKIVTSLAPLVLQLAEAIVPLVAMLGEQLGPVLEPLLEALLALLPVLLQMSSIVLSALLPALGPLLPLLAEMIAIGFKPLTEVLIALMPIFTLLGQTIGLVMTVIGGIVSTVVALMNRDFESIGKIWEDVWTGVADFAIGIFNTINGILEGFINGAIDLINGLTSRLQPFLDGLELSTGGVIDINLAKIPHVSLPRLETGGDVLGSRHGTAAILGENYQAESVVNRGRTNRLIERANSLAARALASGTGGGDTTWNLYETVSADALAKSVARRQNRLLA
jgi:phage-related protein